MSLHHSAFVVSWLEVQTETKNPEGLNKFHAINSLQMCLVLIELKPFCLLNEKLFSFSHFVCARGLAFYFTRNLKKNSNKSY